MLMYPAMSSTKETGSSNGNWTQGDVQVDRFKSYECPGSVDALRQSHTSLFQSRPYCECYSKAYGVSLHSWALKPISGPERNIPTGHRLGMLHSIIGDLLAFESFGLILCLFSQRDGSLLKM